MKRILTIFFFLAGFGTLVLLGLRINLINNRTSVEVNEKVIENSIFSKSSKNEAKADFLIKNVGKSSLIIYKINTDCTCTLYRLKKDIIPPNDSTIVTLIVDKSFEGHFSHFAEVYCNSENSPIFLLFNGTIIP
jgi:hypothetical protein